MENKFEFEDVKWKMPRSVLVYVASDGKKFDNRTEYELHQAILNLQLEIWFAKRFTLRWMLMYFLFKKEPKKPYKF